MANLICAADGNWTTNTTWANAEAGSGAAMVTRSAATSVTGTSYTWSSAFTCTNTDVMDGMLLHLKRNGVTGTVIVGISADNGTSAAKEVTVNASDIPADACWFFFKFDSTLTADGGSDYKVGVKCSTGGSGATVYRDGTAGNWSRLVRTTANPAGAPAAGDNTFIAKEWTAAATGTARSVTMDNTGTTDHGTVDVCQGGTLSFGSSASTNYLLKVSGDVNVWSGGTLNMGTVATPIPSTSTAKLNLDCGSNVQYGLLIQAGGTLVGQGASKTVWTYLAADAALNATSLTTADSTSWSDNDAIAISGTTKTYTQAEVGAMNGAAAGTTITVDGFAGTGGGVKYAHSGTAPTRAEIVNLTRNVALYGASASYQSYVYIAATASVDLDYVEFYWLGSATTNKRGIDVLTTTGSFNMQYCSLHDFSVANSDGPRIDGGTADNFVFSNNVSYNINYYHFLINAATSGTTWTVSNNVCIYSPGNGIFYFADVGGVITGNTAANSTYSGFALVESASFGTFSGNIAHGNNDKGFTFEAAPINSTFSDLTSFRNYNDGIGIVPATTEKMVNCTFDGLTLFGNGQVNVRINCPTLDCTFTDVMLAGDSSFATPYGLYINNADSYYVYGLKVISSSFGVASGIFVAHSTRDITVGSPIANTLLCIKLNDTVLGSSDTVSLSSAAWKGSYVSCQGLSAGNHKTFFAMGTSGVDSAIYNTDSPSERLTPSSASVKLESGPHRKSVDSGGTATFSVYIRKSAVGDGAAYNGNQPRLILRSNASLGITDDVTLDTAAAAAGGWELLTGTSAAVTDNGVLEAYVDCDGTAGWINVDDWA